MASARTKVSADDARRAAARSYENTEKRPALANTRVTQNNAKPDATRCGRCDVAAMCNGSKN